METEVKPVLLGVKKFAVQTDFTKTDLTQTDLTQSDYTQTDLTHTDFLTNIPVLRFGMGPQKFALQLKKLVSEC